MRQTLFVLWSISNISTDANPGYPVAIWHWSWLKGKPQNLQKIKNYISAVEISTESFDCARLKLLARAAKILGDNFFVCGISYFCIVFCTFYPHHTWTLKSPFHAAFALISTFARFQSKHNKLMEKTSMNKCTFCVRVRVYCWKLMFLLF